jgi:hypothetical protein
VETARPEASAEEPVVVAELADTRVLLANLASRDQAAAGPLRAVRLRPEVVSLASRVNLQASPEVDSEQVSEPVLAQGREAQRVAPEADLGGELGRAVARARMRSMEF